MNDLNRLSASLVIVALFSCNSTPHEHTQTTTHPLVDADNVLFTDSFESGTLNSWTIVSGKWDVGQRPGWELGNQEPHESAVVTGQSDWGDYELSADVYLTDSNLPGGVALLGRVQDDKNFYQFELKRHPRSGKRRWWIWKKQSGQWIKLASGRFAFDAHTYYRMRFSLVGSQLSAAVSEDSGISYRQLGGAEDHQWQTGRVGLRAWGTQARFDDVRVRPDDGAAWGPLVTLRDDTPTWSLHKPPSGWWVTPVHATLLLDGRVLLTGWGRHDRSGCTSGHRRMNGTSFVLDPAALDTSDGTLWITPLDERGSPPDDKLYCAGHVTGSDGRIFYTGGSSYERLGTPEEVERGLNYARVFDPSAGSFTRIDATMRGGPAGKAGIRWYPTNTLLPSGKLLVTSGFTKCCGVQFTNRSIELFDPAAESAAGDPWTELATHDEAPVAVGPDLLDYTHVYTMRRPLLSGDGVSRSLALFGGNGRMVLFTEATGFAGSARFAAPAAGSRPEAPTQAGAGASGAQLEDGRLVVAGGSSSGVAAQRIDVYDPVSDAWQSLDTGISRFHGSTVLLPDGTLLLVNGYVSGTGYLGDLRKPQLVDPIANTVTTLTTWPNDSLERGYHSFALLLRDGRVLLGGGTATGHRVGCERPDVRVFSPPYLSRGTRPVVFAREQPLALQIAGAPIALAVSSEPLRTDRPGVVLMAPGSVTHNFNQGQRIVPLPYAPSQTESGFEILIAAPADANQAPPGPYLLHTISARGVPSEGIPVMVLPPS